MMIFLFQENCFGQLNVPITKFMPNKGIQGLRSLIKGISVQCRSHSPQRIGDFCDNPLVFIQCHRLRIKSRIPNTPVHFPKTGGVPQFGGEIAIALDTGRVQFHITPLGGHDGQSKAQSIRTVTVHQIQRVHDIALGF